MAREILERDLDLNGLAVYNPRVATLPNDVICLRDMPTFTSGLTQDPVTKVVTGDYITGKAGGQTWTGGTAANDNLTIRTTNAANATGTLNFTAPHTTWTTDQTIASATSAVLDAIKVNPSTITVSGSTNITTAAGFNTINIQQATLTSVSPLTVTNAATLMIFAGPNNTGNLNITNRYALWIQNHAFRHDGCDDSFRAIFLNRASEQDIVKHGGPLGFGTDDNNNFGLFTNNQTRLFIGGSGQIIFANNNVFTQVPGVGVAYRLDETVTSATSATLDNVLYDTSTITVSGSTPITTATGLNNVTYRAPVYNGTPTITRGATVAILGAPTGTAPITNRYALDVQSGTTNLQGAVVIQALTGLLKATSGVVGVGTGGTDFEFPLTFSQGLTRAANAVTGDYITGKTGAQVWTGSTDSASASGTLNIRSSSNAAPGALTLSGGPIVFSTSGITVASGTSANLNAISAPAATVTVTGSTTIANGFNYFLVNAPTITDASAVTIATAGTFVINGGPLTGGSASITTPYGLIVQGAGGNALFGGRVWQGSVVSAVTTNQWYSSNSQTVASGAGAVLDSTLWDSATTTLTGVTTVATANGFNQNTFKAPVFNGATVTITNAATVAISGAPTGTATITNPFAFWVQTGTTKLGGTTVIQALTGMLKGTSGTVSVAVAGTDYQAALTPADSTISFPTGTTIKVNQLSNKFIVQGTADSMLTGAQFLGGLGTGLLKNTTTTGVLSIATAGTDFESPLIFSTGLTRTVNTITDDLATGKAGGLTATGGTAASESLTLQSTTNATKGRVLNGSWFALDETNHRVLIGSQTAGVGAPLTISSVDGGGSLRAIHLNQAAEQDIIKTGGVLGFGTADAQNLGVLTNNIVRLSLNGSGQMIATNRNSIAGITTGNSFVFRYDASVLSAAGATLDAILVDTATVTLTGATHVTTPAGFNYVTIKGPTYTSGSTLTVDQAATVAIAGPPVAAGSTIIGTPLSLWVQAGTSLFSGNTSMQGSVTIQSLTGMLKASGGVVSVGTAGTDYESPLTFSTGLTRSGNTITADLSTGVSGGQAVIGGTVSGNTLSLRSNTANNGRILVGSWFAIDETNQRVIIGSQTAGVGAPLTISTTDSGGNLRAIHLTAGTEQDITKTGGILGIGTSDAQNVGIYTSNTVRVSLQSGGNAIFANSTLGSLVAGNGIAFRYNQTVTTSTSATLDNFLFDQSVITLNSAGTITTAAGFNNTTFKAPTYTSTSAVTIQRAATVAIQNAPNPTGTGPVSITNPSALWLQNGCLTISGVNPSTIAIVLDRSGEQDVIKSGGIFGLGTSDNNNLTLITSNQARVVLNGSGQAIHTNRASVGSLTTANQFVTRYDASISQTSSSACNTILFDAGTVTLTGGATSITTTAGFNYATFRQPIFTNSSSMSITNAATVAIEGSPFLGGSLNVTNNMSLWVQSGITRLNGSVILKNATGSGLNFTDGGGGSGAGGYGGSLDSHIAFEFEDFRLITTLAVGPNPRCFVPCRMTGVSTFGSVTGPNCYIPLYIDNGG